MPLKPDTCKKFKPSKIAFVARNNIKIYLDGCKELGMTDLDVFETEDLYKTKRLTAVLDNIYAVSAYCRKFDFKAHSLELSCMNQISVISQKNNSKKQTKNWLPIP